MNNIIESPQSRSLRMVKALNAFDAMDDSKLLADEFRLLAETGLAEANFYLGCMYENGNNGLPEDIPLALEQYEQIKDYNQNPIACFMLGRIYQYGEGV